MGPIHDQIVSKPAENSRCAADWVTIPHKFPSLSFIRRDLEPANVENLVTSYFKLSIAVLPPSLSRFTFASIFGVIFVP
jgi:hypothetical protein